MRDSERIEPFLNQLKELWLKYPDLRFGQLVLKLYGPMPSRYVGNGNYVDLRNIGFIYNMEESDWLKRIEEFK